MIVVRLDAPAGVSPGDGMCMAVASSCEERSGDSPRVLQKLIGSIRMVGGAMRVLCVNVLVGYKILLILMSATVSGRLDTPYPRSTTASAEPLLESNAYAIANANASAEMLNTT